MAHSIQLGERTRAAIQHRLGGVAATDVPTYRRIARLYDVLHLDELPDDSQARLGQPGSHWGPPASYVLTSAHRDDLIKWLEPTERYPLTGFMGRLLVPVFDELKQGRDGPPANEEGASES